MKRDTLIIGKLIIFLITVLSFAAVILLGNKFYDFNSDSLIVYVIFAVMGVFLGSFIDTLFHEGFHLLFGKFAGMKFQSMTLGFFTVYRSGKRIKISSSGGKEYAGCCSMIFKNPDNIAKKYIIHTLGGLIGTFVHLMFCVSVVVFPHAFGMYCYAFFAFGLPIALYMLLFNGIPMKAQGMSTDAGVILGLAKKDASAIVSIAIMQLQSMVFSGMRPSEIDEKHYFSVPVLPEDDSNFGILLNWRYLYYLDNGDCEKALEISAREEELLEYMPEVYRGGIVADFLYNSCALKTDREKAQEYYNECKDFLFSLTNETNLRIRAAYALYAEDDIPNAKALLLRAKDAAENSHNLGLARFELNLIENMRAEVKKREDKIEEEKQALRKNQMFIFKPRPGDIQESDK